MIELDFTLLEAPELWHKTGAAATPEEFVDDLYPGHLTLRVAGVDLSPPGAPAFFGFAPAVTQGLARLEENGSFDAQVWLASDDRIRVRQEGNNEVRVSVDWSAGSGAVPAAELRVAWAWFVKRIIAVLVGRDSSAADPAVARQTVAAADGIIAGGDAPSLLDARGLPSNTRMERARRQVEAFCWSYGGFGGVGISPVVVELIAGDVVLVDGWDGDWVDGAPCYRAIVPHDADTRTYERVFGSAVVDVLTDSGRADTRLAEALRRRQVGPTYPNETPAELAFVEG